MVRKPTIYTVGHSTRSLAELVAILEAHGVRQLVDIRSIRRSRANPQFEAAALARGLRRQGIAYVAIDSLGGRRPKADPSPALSDDGWEHASFRNYADYAQTQAFRAGLDELLALAKVAPTAIMCAEAVWWRCHRRIVADHLLARGVPVVHVLSATKAEPATPTPFAVFTRGRVHYPRTRDTAGGGRADRRSRTHQRRPLPARAGRGSGTRNPRRRRRRAARSPALAARCGLVE